MIIPRQLLFTALTCATVLGGEKEEAIRPGSIRPEELREYATLDPNRKKLIDAALDLAAGEQWLTYTYGSAEPSNGGLDCSGSMYYLMQQVKIDPPRTSRDQCEWVKDANKFTEVPSTATSLDDPAFDKLTPGDLLFWSGTTGGDEGTVSHVQMFLGHEKSDGLAVMVGASDGRSYRGKRRDGYGVFDFKLPVAGSKAHFLGYGPPATLALARPPVLAKNDGRVQAKPDETKVEKPARVEAYQKNSATQAKKNGPPAEEEKDRPAVKKKPKPAADADEDRPVVKKKPKPATDEDEDRPAVKKKPKPATDEDEDRPVVKKKPKADSGETPVRKKKRS
ncbi:MAG: cell wall-associated NlpC family hydrolase [Akkermansiaceae bacterium]|nr:cell wall-associated NlpC family hydrolase [Akkermansiaceae bacterium]